MNGPSLTRALARTIRERETTPEDLRGAERYVRDFLGSLVAGPTERPGRLLLSYGDHRRDVEGRVFLAAALAHVTETDDLHPASVTHPGCVVIPVALAVGREEDVPGPRALRAVLAGYEAMIRVGEALGPGHYRTFHNTATAGVFGAAAAAAELLDLDEDGWVWALGSAGTQAAGLWQFGLEGAMSKHLHAGHAASAGLRSALLARRGFTGAEAILEGPRGFFAGFCPDPDPGAVLRPSEGWKLAETGLKPYPCCRHVHPAIDAALELRERLGPARDRGTVGLEEDVDEVRIRTYAAARRITDRPEPETPYAAKFSLQYAVARALVDGAPGLRSFDAERLGEGPVRALIEGTAVEESEELEAAYPERWGAEVRLRTADGRVHVARATVPRGDPDRPLTEGELDGKVRGLFEAGGIEAAEADRLLERCRALPEGGDPFPLPVPARSSATLDPPSRRGSGG